MAGPAADFPLPNSSFFNIYSDGGPLARTSPAPSLPGGQCNFVDLSHGANGPRCGCRRFWSRGAPGPTSPVGFPGYSNGVAAGNQTDQAFWCMCAHHACFHDEIRDGQSPAVATANVTAGQENERPRANREPLTPVIQDLSFKMPPPTGQSMDFHTFNHASFSTNLQEDRGMPQGEAPTPAHQTSLPDTLSWGDFIQSQGDHQTSMLPPIPSQCLLPSQPSSTTSSTSIGYLRPFSGKGLQTLSGVKSKLREPLVITAEEAQLPDEDAADTIPEPSVDGLQTVTNTPRSTRRRDAMERPSQAPTSGPSHSGFQQLSNTVQSHEQRLDRLESVSFSADAHDDCHNQHDQTDIRVTELEGRVEEVEKMLNDTSSQVSGHNRSRLRGVDESTASVVSVSTNASGKTDRAALHEDLQALKAQLSQMQGLSSFPTYTNPWEIEVVFLPFPLKGVWMESRDFPSQRQSGGSNVDVDQWTQLPNSASAMEPHSPGLYEWAGPELESEWLLARACPPDRMIDKRLRSRGLVKNVTVRGPDARSVQQAVSTAFGTLFRTLSRMQANAHHGSTAHHRVARFLGLQQPWVPLRKVHKDSRLRFLSPAEMVTPATWDVSFLGSSVVMKATGTQRLFITQPEAYLQNQEAYDNGWGWQRLRELSRVYPDSQSSQLDVPEADAMEDYWTWNDRLDEHPESQTSSGPLSLRQAAQPRFKSTSLNSSPQVFFPSHTGESPSLSTGRSRAQSPFALKERKPPPPSRPLHVRTTSMPPSLPLLISPSQAKRRVTSANFTNVYPRPYDRRPSPQLMRANTSTAHSLIAQRRRNTRSPSVPLSARLRNTPRWSTASPPPIPEAVNHGAFSKGGLGGRQTTPFQFATPFSNAPFEPRPSRAGADVNDDLGSGTDESFDMADHAGQGSDYDDEESDEDGDSPMLDLGHPRRRRHDEDEDWHGAQTRHQQLPEDEPWPGIEDEENRDPEALALDSFSSQRNDGHSSGPRVDIFEDEDAMIDGNSPSDVDIFEDVDAGARDVVPREEVIGQDRGLTDVDVDRMSQHSSVPSEYPSTQRAWPDGLEEFR